MTASISVLAGDDEEQYIPTDVQDAWVHGSTLEGDSGFTSPSTVDRIDRVMVYNGQNDTNSSNMRVRVRPTTIRRIGTTNIEGT